MDISLHISAEGMDGKKDTGKKSFSLSPLFNDVCCYEGNEVHQVAVKPEEVPEFRRHSKGDVLPGSFGKGVQAVFNPDVGCLFTAGGAESGFATVWNFDALRAGRTDKVMVTEKRSSAYKEF
jgi:hypothetical protein